MLWKATGPGWLGHRRAQSLALRWHRSSQDQGHMSTPLATILIRDRTEAGLPEACRMVTPDGRVRRVGPVVMARDSVRVDLLVDGEPAVIVWESVAVSLVSRGPVHYRLVIERP